MTKWIRNMSFFPNGDRVGLPIQLLFTNSLLIGLFFLLPPGLTGMEATMIFSLSSVVLGNLIPVLWGIGMLVVALLYSLAMGFRIPKLFRIPPVIAFYLYIIMFIIYVLNGFWLGALTVALPNIIFWTWANAEMHYQKNFLQRLDDLLGPDVDLR